MIEQPDLFDDGSGGVEVTVTVRVPRPRRQKTGRELKQEGIAAAENANLSAVAYARELAHDIAMSRKDRCCSMVDVNAALAKEKRPGLGNASGAVFLTHVWEWTKERVVDPRPHAKCNEVKKWRLKHA